VVARNCKRGCDGAFGGSLESDGGFCVVEFGKNLAPVAVKMLPQFVYFIKTFYKLCTSSGICRDNAVINRVNFGVSQSVLVNI
jgi:hypothetical protein